MTKARTSHQFKLSPEEFNLLRQLFAHDEALAGLLPRQVDVRGDKLTLGIDRTEAERIREYLTKRLAESGFDKDYSPTKQGEMLEELIDRFYVS